MTLLQVRNWSALFVRDCTATRPTFVLIFVNVIKAYEYRVLFVQGRSLATTLCADILRVNTKQSSAWRRFNITSRILNRCPITIPKEERAGLRAFFAETSARWKQFTRPEIWYVNIPSKDLSGIFWECFAKDFYW